MKKSSVYPKPLWPHANRSIRESVSKFIEPEISVVGMNPFIRNLKAITQLGLRSSFYYGLYRFGLWSGHYRRLTPVGLYLSLPEAAIEKARWPFIQPEIPILKSTLSEKKNELKKEADEVCRNQIRFFGNPPQIYSFQKDSNENQTHWSEWESRKHKHETDIKTIWEPARFNWVFPLIRAYVFYSDETYAQKFWELFKGFTSANPFNAGPNWSSAQEVSLRMNALIFAGSILRNSPSTKSQDLTLLIASIYLHAKRIAPTLAYARAQNNNHLLTEAVGLYTAGSMFEALPTANEWKVFGWKLFNLAIQEQISINGEYTQHSLNYHRLMLQASLWMSFIVRNNHCVLPEATLAKLAMATKWLLNYLEPLDGHVPNLGHNDGSNIFPLAQCDHADYRPVMQAAAACFLGKAELPSGPWDEQLAWLDLPVSTRKIKISEPIHANNVPWIGDADTRIYLQAIDFHSRPAHADQLHVDIWHKGNNLALDAGTYSYNAPPPWENALAQTAVHNTITIDGRDQMLPAGKFLWLEWADARVYMFEPENKLLKAEHDGFRRLGVRHSREIRMATPKIFFVSDRLDNSHAQQLHDACLHWLLPDWPWELEKTTLLLRAPFGHIEIKFGNDKMEKAKIDLIREGESLLLKKGTNPNRGWYSPTYARRVPALSLTYSLKFAASMIITSNWQIRDGSRE
jgi:hypothetical protein